MKTTMSGKVFLGVIFLLSIFIGKGFTEIFKAPYPVILIHGINSSSQTWGMWYERSDEWSDGLVKHLVEADYDFGCSFYWPNDHRLKDDGSENSLLAWRPQEGFDIVINTKAPNSIIQGDVYTLTFPVENQINGNTFIDMVDDLIPIINAVKSVNYVDKVILVGHSKGGLVSRAYLQSFVYHQRDDVAMLISMGTPFLGSGMAETIYHSLSIAPKNLSFYEFVESLPRGNLRSFVDALVQEHLKPYWRDITLKDLFRIKASNPSDSNPYLNFLDSSSAESLPNNVAYCCVVYQDVIYDSLGDGNFPEYIKSFDVEGKIASLNNSELLDVLPSKGGDSAVNVLSQNLRNTQAGFKLGPEKIMVLFTGAQYGGLMLMHIKEVTSSSTYLQFVRAVNWYVEQNPISNEKPIPDPESLFTTITVPLDLLPELTPLEIVLIPAGEFIMGTSVDNFHNVQHQVTLTRSFYVGKYEITQAQYMAVMGNNPSYFEDKPGHPVENVNWFDCAQFCNKLSKLTGKIPVYNENDWTVNLDANGFRLPTEAEWEYAYRAGTNTIFYWGDDPNSVEIGKYAWYGDNSDRQTHPVGLKLPNIWGLYDMAGNVYEWSNDWSEEKTSDPQIDPINKFDDLFRATMGGDHVWRAEYCQAVSYSGVNPNYGNSGVGFRIVASFSETEVASWFVY